MDPARFLGESDGPAGFTSRTSSISPAFSSSTSSSSAPSAVSRSRSSPLRARNARTDPRRLCAGGVSVGVPGGDGFGVTNESSAVPGGEGLRGGGSFFGEFASPRVSLSGISKRPRLFAFRRTLFPMCCSSSMSAGGCASMYARASVMDPYRAGMRGVSWRSIPRARVSSDSTLPPPPPPRGSMGDFGMFFLAGCFPRLPRLSVVGVGLMRVVARGSGTRPTASSQVGGVSTTSRSEHMSSAASMSSSLTTRRR